MKILKTLIATLLIFCIILPFGVVFAENPPILSAVSAILIDGKTGNILYEKDSEREMYPASTTKIITYLVISDAIEEGEISLDDMLTFTREMQDKMDSDGSHIELKAGEKMSVENLIRAMLIASGNDAATLLATTVGGNEENFVKRMNQKADELGLIHSHFTNAHGLTDPDHFTTAKDLATAAKVAMEDDFFRQIVGSKTLNIAPTNKTENERYFINTNNLVSYLRYSNYYYSKATGIKTGYTDAAGSCLVASATQKDRDLICVVLKSEHSHEEAKALLEYGFNNFKQVEIAKKGDILGETKVKQGAGVDHVRAVAKENIVITLPLDANVDDIKSTIKYSSDEVYAPVKKGDTLGTITYTYGKKVVGTSKIVAEKEVKRHIFGFLMTLGEKIWGLTIVKVIVYLLLTLVILFILLVVYGFYLSIKRSKARKRRRKKYHPPLY
ncbi:MAG: D-alanyl-D-alanine carboxypeptidase [Clostridia bacterium]|nr:D-alanyl-D-alanine carboxypeptidase [Clostridia bacterium]